jgi:hypothetical protein
MMLFEVFQSTSNLWYFHLRARNNEIIAVSEGYHNVGDIRDLWMKYFQDWEWRDVDVASGKANREGDGDSEGEPRPGKADTGPVPGA